MKRFALAVSLSLVALPIHAQEPVPTFKADGSARAAPLEVSPQPGRTLFELLRLPGDFVGRRVLVEMLIEDVFPSKDAFSIRYRANGRTHYGDRERVRFRIAEPLARELIAKAGTAEDYDLVVVSISREDGRYVAEIERVRAMSEDGAILFDVPAPPR
jgi:hypothetical protein